MGTRIISINGVGPIVVDDPKVKKGLGVKMAAVMSFGRKKPQARGPPVNVPAEELYATCPIAE